MAFALIDCNNFYTSCERVFNPKLQNLPIAILSNNDGCIISRSNELKDLGIPMAAPIYKYKAICKQHKVQILSSNYALYGDISNRIMNLLKEYIPEVEVYSIDEAFLKIEDCSDLLSYMQNIRNMITKYIGIPTSIGIGPTKTLAKIANYIAKKEQGVFDLHDSTTRDIALSKFKVADIWGIGRKLSIYLNDMGIKTAADLRDYDISAIRDRFTVVGERLVRELRGEACYELTEPAPKKSIVCSRSFGHPVTDFKELAEAVSNHAASAAVKLRRQDSKSYKLGVSIKTNYFKTEERQYSNFGAIDFIDATNDSRELIKNAKVVLSKIYKHGYKYKKVGVILMNIIDSSAKQGVLFGESSYDNNNAKLLMGAIDKLNNKMGKNTVFMAAQGTTRKWAMRRDFKSPAYTTNWNELMKVY